MEKLSSWLTGQYVAFTTYRDGLVAGEEGQTLAEYALMVTSAVTAAAYVFVGEAIQVCLLALWAVIYCSCMYAVRTLETRRAGCP